MPVHDPVALAPKGSVSAGGPALNGLACGPGAAQANGFLDIRKGQGGVPNDSEYGNGNGHSPVDVRAPSPLQQHIESQPRCG